jgi:TRAP-type C4-dicarboxylate transport system permease small subunit
LLAWEVGERFFGGQGIRTMNEPRHADRVHTLLDRIGSLLVYIAACALFVMFVFVCLSAFMRYLVQRPFDFTEEFVGLLFLVTVFLSLPYATSRKMHMNVTIGIGRLKGRWRAIFAGFNLIVMFAFSAWFAVLSYDFTAFAYDIDAASEQVSITLWPWMAMLPAVSGLIALIALVQFVQLVIYGDVPVSTESPEQDAPL